MEMDFMDDFLIVCYTSCAHCDISSISSIILHFSRFNITFQRGYKKTNIHSLVCLHHFAFQTRSAIFVEYFSTILFCRSTSFHHHFFQTQVQTRKSKLKKRVSIQFNYDAYFVAHSGRGGHQNHGCR